MVELLNQVLARVFRDMFEDGMSPFMKKKALAIEEGRFEWSGNSGMIFDKGILETKWSKKLVNYAVALRAYPQFMEEVKTEDDAWRVSNYYKLENQNLSLNVSTYGRVAPMFVAGIEGLLDGSKLETLFVAGAFSPASVKYVLAFTERFNPESVVVADVDPFLAKMCEIDNISADVRVCDFQDREQVDALPEYDVSLANDLFNPQWNSQIERNYKLTRTQILNLARRKRKSDYGGLLFIDIAKINSSLDCLDLSSEGLEVLETFYRADLLANHPTYGDLRGDFSSKRTTHAVDTIKIGNERII